jgi:hypothetical protein
VRLRHRFEVDRFEEAVLGRLDGEIHLDVDDIPVDAAGVDHGLQLAIVGRAVLQHLDAGRGGKGLRPGFGLGFLGRSAPAGEYHFLGLRGRRGQKSGKDASEDQFHVVLLCLLSLSAFHGRVVFASAVIPARGATA